MIEQLPNKITAIIDKDLLKFPADSPQSAIMPSLTLVQDEYGHLTLELMDLVASYLKVPQISVYEVASFYSMYDLEPGAKYKISVCTNISCMLCDCDKITKYLRDKLESNNKFSLKEVECLAACDKAPVMIINKKYHYNLTESKVDKILEELA